MFKIESLCCILLNKIKSNETNLNMFQEFYVLFPRKCLAKKFFKILSEWGNNNSAIHWLEATKELQKNK